MFSNIQKKIYDGRSDMSFKDQPFDTRYQQMGDEAEQMFEKTHPRNFLRYGLDRPPIQVWRLPPFVRYTPDYLCSDGLYEVQGCGQDGLIKIKFEKLEALRQWNTLCPAYFWFWDRANKQYTILSVQDAVNGTQVFKKGTFPEGKDYWEIPVGWLQGWRHAPT
jgi:hypothetical protein